MLGDIEGEYPAASFARWLVRLIGVYVKRRSNLSVKELGKGPCLVAIRSFFNSTMIKET